VLPGRRRLKKVVARVFPDAAAVSVLVLHVGAGLLHCSAVQRGLRRQAQGEANTVLSSLTFIFTSFVMVPRGQRKRTDLQKN